MGSKESMVTSLMEPMQLLYELQSLIFNIIVKVSLEGRTTATELNWKVETIESFDFILLYCGENWENPIKISLHV